MQVPLFIVWLKLKKWKIKQKDWFTKKLWAAPNERNELEVIEVPDSLTTGRLQIVRDLDLPH